MPDLTVVNPANFAGALAVSAVGSASDRFATTRGRRYLMRVNNAHASSQNFTVDDPTSVLPPGGSGTPGTFADVVVPVLNATTRSFMVEADRFADANGWVNLVFGIAGAMNVEVYGPL